MIDQNKNDMDGQDEEKTIFIKQIAIDGGKHGYNGVIYGVGADGTVYEYDRHKIGWKRLSDVILPEG